MRIVIVGQQAFGKSVLEAFLARGDTIAGVFAAPEKPGARPDPLVAAAEEKKLPVYRFPKYSDAEAHEALKGLNADIGVMAYVLLFAPPEFCAIPKHGMIQFHPSLLPLHRGPAAIPWAIIRGRSETGLTIFRPTPGLDEGPGHPAEARARSAPTTPPPRSISTRSSRSGSRRWCRPPIWSSPAAPPNGPRTRARRPMRAGCARPRARINWANHVDFVYDLIRGCNPAPGAWTTRWASKKLYLFDAKKVMAPTFGAVRGKKLGEVVSAGPEGMRIHAQGGFIEVSRVRLDDGAKIKSTDAEIAVGTILGN